MTLGQELAATFARELDRMADQIDAYASDDAIWTTHGAQKNSPGTLAVHTVGGLLHFVDAGLGGSDYVRDRDFEFRERDVTRADVIARLRACRDAIVPVLESLDDETLAAPYPGPLPPALQGLSTRAFLLTMVWHLGWHTGHIYYHRLGQGSAGIG